MNFLDTPGPTQMMRISVFIAEDDAAIRDTLCRRLPRNHYRVRAFESGEALVDALDRELPDLVLVDLTLPGMSGHEVLETVKHRSPHSLVLLMTAHGTVEDVVAAMRQGAYDVVLKTGPLDSLDRAVMRATDLCLLRRQARIETLHAETPYALGNLAVSSAAMKHLLAEIEEVLNTPKTTVLLQGETGTGKEFLARVLHHNGPRAAGPFVAVNCTAIPPDRFESELFGHERRAFTGAVHQKLGLLEQADGGTLFLDEVGDLDLPMQAKLVRVLQERSCRRLGGAADVQVDFQLIAATKRDLREEVARGRFRDDLFFRLNVARLLLPPLRNRVEDIVPLCFRALTRFSAECGKEITDIDPEARSLLERYPYPGNIRELQNMIERSVIFCHNRTLTTACLPHELHEALPDPTVHVTKGDKPRVRLEIPVEDASLTKVEDAVITAMLRRFNFNKTLTAKHLGITRSALSRRLRKTGATAEA